MSEVELLNNEKHKNLRVSATYAPGLGYDSGAVMLLPNEIVEAQREYPILFRKHPETGAFFINALLGFEEKENLFLKNSKTDVSGLLGDDLGWGARHIPWAYAKGPFLIGFNKQFDETKPVISIMVNDPRVSDSDGERLFDDDASPTAYLHSVNEILAATHEGIQQLEPMIKAYSDLGLIESLNLDITLKNGKKINFGGAYTISEERLRELPSDDLLDLNQKGYLSIAYYIAGSLANLRKLIDMKNKAK